MIRMNIHRKKNQVGGGKILMSNESIKYIQLWCKVKTLKKHGF